jgi:DNA-binding XRE family transcriptional regulator
MSRIKEQARAQGYNTPESLGQQAGITRTTMYNVWQGPIGKRRLETLIAIAKALALPLEDLYQVGD